MYMIQKTVMLLPRRALFVIAAALFVLAGCSGARQSAVPPIAQDSSVVAVLAGEAFTLSEFEERYARSVGGREAAADDSLAAYQDFLERYVNFLLKVRAAEAAGFAQDSTIRAEIATYRTNLARPYLLEQEVLEPIVRDLYAKKKEMVDASHILIRLPGQAPPADTLEAYQKLAVVVDSIRQGADFGEMAFRHSEDPSARRAPGSPGYQGRLGFFSAGRLVKDFEDQAYATPVGGMSPIFRTQFGYHVLYVHDRQPAVPDIQVSHIQVRPEGATPADSAAALERIREARQRIASGADFAEVAQEYSVDRTSAVRGGDLGFISMDMPIIASFRDAAFALENVGDVSDVVETPFGYHLIKLTDRKVPPSYEEAYPDLKQEASRLPRAREAEEELAERLRAQYEASVDTTTLYQAFAGVATDSVLIYLAGDRLPEAAYERQVATLDTASYTLGDVAVYARTASIPAAMDKHVYLDGLMDQFLRDRAIDYEASILEHRDEEFGAVMKEFRSGLLLFKLMEDSVWTAAERDTAGLRAYYDAHAAEYRFPERTRILSLFGRSDSLLARAAARLDADTSFAALTEELLADTTTTFRVDTTFVSGETNSVYDQALTLGEGQRTAPIPQRGGYLVLINDGTVPPRPKTFAEARTEVVSGYQKVLEDDLIERLRDRYDVYTFPSRLHAAFAEAGPMVPATGSTAEE